ERIGRAFDLPLVANMVEGGRTPILARDELEQLGFKIAIFPTAGLLATAAALASVFEELRERGSTKDWNGKFYNFDAFSRLMGFERVWDFERRNVETD
ncbi:MAG: carboxyvinyl-carboxyphosphonate phosphorylmutase, partial [Stellaceae bacterium]